jgi:aspartate aminotransferase-like enzyme
MQQEGIDAVFARHEACAAATRAGLESLGFDLFADPRYASRTVTCVRLAEGVEWKALNGAVKKRGVVLAGGQGKLTGQVFRVGHLGSVTVEEILGTIGALEAVVLEQGRDIEPGAAVAAAQAAALASRGIARAAAATA